MKREFPTINQLIGAIDFWSCGSCCQIVYNTKNCTFKVTELVPYPVRDSGGSIDSADFTEHTSEMTYLTAYTLWRDMKALLDDNNIPEPVPVVTLTDEGDFDLPF